MRQQTLAVATGFERYGRQTRRAEFLAAMEAVVPWADLVALIEPHYPKPGNGRPPVGLERMLRIYFLQQWFNLSDPAVEDALYDSLAMRGFVGIDLGREPVPDETTVCKFRHLLERHQLGRPVLAQVNRYLEQHGMKIGTGTIVDATILGAPSSTKNKSGERDPEMHSTKKNGQWFFGMKAHVGVDAETKLIHSVEVTAANVHDNTVMSNLLHGQETDVWGDQAYQGHPERIHRRAPNAVDRTNQRCKSKLGVREDVREANRIKSKTRARVEHIFALMKLKFGFSKVRYRGMAKNLQRLLATCALINLVTARNRLTQAATHTCA
jgi:IS5 family transposase